MIDPKLNEIPVDKTETLTEEERQARSQSGPRKGLSINETVARNANLSVGAHGVDTSGVAAGAGAGAGSTYVTPTDEGSPAPQINPGGRSTGTTAAADAPAGKTSTDRTSYEKK